MGEWTESMAEDDVQNRELAVHIEAAIFTRAALGNPLTLSAYRICNLSDALDALEIAIAHLMGITVHEVQDMIEGSNFHAAELAALRIGRGVLERLGYTLPVEEDSRQMNQTLAELLFSEYRALLRQRYSLTEAAHHAAKVHVEAERQEQECNNRLQAVGRALDVYGLQAEADTIVDGCHEENKANEQ